MRQAWKTADTYLSAAVKCIDATFGPDYAKKNPQLVAAFINASAHDYHSATMKTGMDDLTAALSRVVAQLSE
jgi:hypothetical protein